MFSAESEELSREVGRARARVANLSEVLRGLRALLDVEVEQVTVAHDGHQQVVEVVGDAAGKLAHRLHLLRVTQLLLEDLALGDVTPHHVKDGPVSLGHGGEQHLDRKHLAISPLVLPLKAVAALRKRDLHHLVRLLERGAPIGLGPRRELGGMRLEQVRFPLVAHHLHGRFVAIHESLSVEDEVRVCGTHEQRSIRVS